MHFVNALTKVSIPVEQTKNEKGEGCGNKNKFITTNVNLRERSFGDFEGLEDQINYNKVWAFDKDDANHTQYNVESVNSVVSRTTALVAELDEEYGNRNILLFAHGDVLQILQTAVLKVDGREHRGLKHLDTAVVRKLTLGGGDDEGEAEYGRRGEGCRKE